MNARDPILRLKAVVTLKLVAALLMLGFWLGSGSLYLHYAGTRPRRPEIATGRIYRYQQIYTVFYLNARERLLWRSMMAAAMACGLVMAVSYFYEERLKKGSTPGRSSTSD